MDSSSPGPRRVDPHGGWIGSIGDDILYGDPLVVELDQKPFIDDFCRLSFAARRCVIHGFLGKISHDGPALPTKK